MPQPNGEDNPLNRRPRRLAPPFKPGVKQQHGVFVKSSAGLKLREQAVRKLVARARKVCSWIQDSDIVTLRDWAELQVVSCAIFADLMEDGHLRPDGAPRKVLNIYLRMKAVMLCFERELGMTPSSRSAITGDPNRPDLVALLASAKVEDTEQPAADGEAEGQ